MKFDRLLVAALALVAVALAPNADASAKVTPQPSLTQPSISPDGKRIAFVADGAIWEVPSSGGNAQLLVSDQAPDSHPLFSPDGTHLAFVSQKTGHGDIYLLDLADGSLERLTWSDVADTPSGFSADGKWLYFTSGRDNVAHFGAVYRVRTSGGTPMPVSLELYRNEQSGVPSPDGGTVALVGQGWGTAQWWRHGHAHIDEGAIWLLKNDGSHDYRRLTPDDARALWPMWSADGKSLYYMSDRSGTENIWNVRLDGDEHPVTRFTDGRCLWPSFSAAAGTIAFQRDFSIWTLDTRTGEARQVPIRLGGAVAGPERTEKRFTDHFSELALSPDGKKLAFVVHGEVFAAAAGADNPGPAHRITHTAAAEFGVAWAPDSRRIVYVSNRDGADRLYLYDFGSGAEKRLTDGPGNDLNPQFSPDGKWIAFIRDGDALDAVNVESGRRRQLAKGELDLHHPLESGRPFAWSPDSRWVAFLAWGPRMYRNAEVVPVAGGKPRAVSFMGNTFADNLWWSPDGKSLFFSTGQRTENGEIARVDLVPKAPEFREQKFLDLFEESPAPGESGRSGGEAAGKAEGKGKQKAAHVSINFDHIARRLDVLPVGLNAGAITLSPDGKTLLFSADVGGHDNLYTWSLDPLALKPPVANQITSSPGDKGAMQFSPDGKTVWYLDDGAIYSVPVKGGHAQRFATSAEMDVDFDAEKEVAFNEAWRWLKDNFHDPDMHGVDWKAVHARYAPLVAGARSDSALQRILNRMVGELNASHSGVRDHHNVPDEVGRIGLRFDPAEYEEHGRFRISEVLPLSPAALAGHVAAGDYLLSIDGTRLGAQSNIDELLAHRIGKQTVLSVADDAAGRHRREVKVKPVDAGSAEQLVYQAWVDHNREMVDRLSHGRLGYIDLPDMSMHSLQQLYQAIDAQNGDKQGVVIDVRNNFGGFVNAYALDALARRHYLSMTFRGMKRVNARPLLGQRALERPTVLITNRVTLSDGEDFTEGYRELGLGKVVGEPTAGWIIYTSNVSLTNGFVVRLPFITITTKAGNPMEMHPRPVDVPVAEPLGESYRGEDARLKAAVDVLLKQLAAGR